MKITKEKFFETKIVPKEVFTTSPYAPEAFQTTKEDIDRISAVLFSSASTRLSKLIAEANKTKQASQELFECVASSLGLFLFLYGDQEMNIGTMLVIMLQLEESRHKMIETIDDEVLRKFSEMSVAQSLAKAKEQGHNPEEVLLGMIMRSVSHNK